MRKIKINPQFADAWIGKGAALGNQGKFEETLTAFDKAIRIDPKSADAWHSKGIALEMLNRYSEANITYAKSKELGYNGTK